MPEMQDYEDWPGVKENTLNTLGSLDGRGLAKQSFVFKGLMGDVSKSCKF